MKLMKKVWAIVLVLALVIGVAPQFCGKDVNAYYTNEENEYDGDPIDYHQQVIDEAKELGVPDAFIKHSFATDYEDGKINEPEVELQDEEDVSVDINVKKSTAGVKGLEIKGVDTGVLARTKIDLGDFDFGNLKLGYLVYNMLAKKTMKGKGYLYLDNDDEPFATLSIKRSGDDDWEEINNKAIDVKSKNISGVHRLSMRYVADSAKDDQDQLIPVSGVKGNLFLESLFFTEGSTPVLDFDLDNEVNSIERINGSEKHTIMGYGNMNLQIPDGYEPEYGTKPVTSATYELDYIRGRGNSTWLASKKPYKVKLDKSTDLFNMGKSKHWVLLANYYDYSLVRNKMTYEMANDMGLEFSPKSVFVDVIISGEYCGSYQLSQQVRVGKNNVNIDDLEEDYATEEPNITGGYLLSMGDSWLKEEDLSDLCVGEYFYVDRPEYDDEYPTDAKNAQLEYIDGYINKITNAVALLEDEESDGKDEDGKTWRDYMDEQSFIDYYLFQEISKNGDAYGGSTYAYKKREGKLYWGPVWDFDFVAWGAYMTNFLSDGGVEGFSEQYSCPWFSTLIKNDEAFKEKVIERWGVMSQLIREYASEGGFIDQYKDKLYYSALANYQVRGSYLMDGVDYWGESQIVNYDDEGNLYTLNYGNEISRLKKTLIAAADWMDENIESVDSGENTNYPPVPFYVDDEIIAYVHFDDEEYQLKQNEIPEAPYKEGKKFKGWYYKDKYGYEHKLSTSTFPYYYENEDSYYYNTRNMKVYDIYAKYVDDKEETNITSIEFPTDTFYVSLDYDDEEYSYYSEGIDLSEFASVIPFDADKYEINYEAKEDYGDACSVSFDGYVKVKEPGSYKVVCSAGNVKRTIRVVGVERDDIEEPGNINVDDNVSLNVGEYGSVNFAFDNTKIYADNYLNIKYKVLDNKVAEVDANGNVYAKAAGTTTVLTILSDGSDVDVKLTTVTVKDASKPEETTTAPSEETTEKTTDTGVKTPSKVVIKKVFAKKKTAKKLKVVLKKANNAKGYQVAVFASKKNAQKNKKALVKKLYKKLTIVVKHKKFKNKKKLFVKARAYNLDGSKKKFGAWSDIKKVKIK